MSSLGSQDSLTRGLLEFNQALQNKTTENLELPSEWIEKHFYVPEPRDVITGEIMPPGPIRLADHQKALINAALARDDKGYLKYTTVIYSCPKKSGKSAIASAVTLYFAYHNDYSHVYCLANDKKQADDRLYQPIYLNFELHKKLGGIFSNVDPKLTEVILPNNSTKIEAIPCDAAGEAGAEPIFTGWSELWAFDTPIKRRLWTELTIPPTKYGRAMRWIESYAGFTGTSDILWQLYEGVVREEYRLPGWGDLPVYSDGLDVFCYWDTEPRLVWQLGEMGARYYAGEAKVHTPSEFQRVHRNQWVSPVTAYVHPEHWHACEDEEVPPLMDPDTPAVAAFDAAVENDCSAGVLVTRDPRYPDTDVAIRECVIFSRDTHSSIILPVGDTIRDWGSRYNLVCIAYDAYQMASMVQNFQQGNITISQDELSGMSEQEVEEYLRKARRAVQKYYYKFSQQNERAIADKMLYDMIVHKNIHWNPTLNNGIAPMGGQETLTKHLLQSGSSSTRGQLRIQKLAPNLKVDASVALSMAVKVCMGLTIHNREMDPEHLVRQLMLEKITYSQFTSAMRTRNLKVTNDGK
jgi:hypothetical protein